MKKILSVIALLAVCVPAFAQFRPPTNYKFDLLGGVPIKIATAGITNIAVPAYIGKDGFSVTPYFVATNNSGSNLAVLAFPMPDGSSTNTTAPTALGNVALNNTTAVRGNIFVPATTFTGCGLVTIQLTNQHLSTITISNLYVGAW